MWRRTLPAVFLGLALGCGGDGGDDGGGGPTTPSTAVTSVAVTFPSGSIFIGTQTQFQATSTLSNGSTQVSVNPTWGSDAPAVATVSPAGIVTAVRAGVATIFADVNPRGQATIRVLPSFQGTWSGSEVVTVCEASGVFDFEDGLCSEFPVGTVFTHNAKFTQAAENVSAEIIFADSTSKMSGTIDVGGELSLPTAAILPAFPGIIADTRNWRSRSDEPSRMTGTYEWVFMIPGEPGSVRQVYELQNVTRSTTATTLSLRAAGGVDKNEIIRHLSRQLGRAR